MGRTTGRGMRMAREPDDLDPRGGPMALLCHDHQKAAPHYAQLNSQPPRCRRHFQMYTAHQSTMRSRKSRGQPIWDYDPGYPRPEDTGALMLDHDDLGYLVNELLKPITEARLGMYDARKANNTKDYQDAAEALSAAAQTLSGWFDDLRIVDIIDKGYRTRR